MDTCRCLTVGPSGKSSEGKTFDTPHNDNRPTRTNYKLPSQRNREGIDDVAGLGILHELHEGGLLDLQSMAQLLMTCLRED
jgi:hypothetical protein